MSAQAFRLFGFFLIKGGRNAAIDIRIDRSGSVDRPSRTVSFFAE